MASTYTDGLAVEIIGSGDKAGSWGDVTNNNLKALEQGVRGFSTIALTGSATTINLPNGGTVSETSGDARIRSSVVKFTGAGANHTVTLQVGGTSTDVKTSFIAINALDSTYSLIIDVGGTDATIPNGYAAHVHVNGTTVTNSFANLAVDKIALKNTEIISNEDDNEILIGADKVILGDGTGDVTLESNGNNNLVVQTGHTDTGTMTIVDGSNGDISITPHGTGKVVMDKVNIGGGEIDGTPIGANSENTGAFTTLSGTTSVTTPSLTNTAALGITTTESNGDITITPHGTGEVNIANVDIGGGAIDDTIIGAAVPAAGTFTTVGTSSDGAITANGSGNISSTTGNISTGGSISTSGSGTMTSAGLLTATAGVTLSTGGTLNVGSLGISNAGSIAGASTISASGNIVSDSGNIQVSDGNLGVGVSAGGAGSGNISADGLITTSGNITTTSTGTITAANGLTVTAGGIDLNGGNLDLASGGITNTGAIAGATTINASGTSTLVAVNASGNIATTGSGTITSAGRVTSGGGLNAGGTITGATTIDASGNITGIWNGDIIPEAKLQNQSGTNTGDNPGVTGITRGAGLGTGTITTSGTLAVDGNLEDLDALGEVGSNGQMIVGTGPGAYAYESGDTLRTSIGVGASDAPTLVGTNISGTAASLTAGTVTTNANLTGDVTSSGNSTTIADDIVDEAMLNVSNAPVNDYVLSVNSVLGGTGTLTWVTNVAGDLTDVLAGANISVADSAGPQPTVSLNSAISLAAVTATLGMTTPVLTSTAGLSIRTTSNGNLSLAPHGTGTVQITGGQYLNLSGTAGSGGYGLRGTSLTLNASNTASDGWGQVYHSGMTSGEGAYFETTISTLPTTSGQTRVLHGFSSVPRMFTASYKLKALQTDSFVNEAEILISNHPVEFASPEEAVVTPYRDSSYVGVTILYDATNGYVAVNTSGVQFSLATAKWDIVLRCWL
jgi:hypothetical protein